MEKTYSNLRPSRLAVGKNGLKTPSSVDFSKLKSVASTYMYVVIVFFSRRVQPEAVRGGWEGGAGD